MNKTWTIVKHEYTRHVFRRRFLIALLSLPVIFLFVFVMMLGAVALSFNRSPVGYVDQAKFIKINVLPRKSFSFISYQFLPYPDETAARDALNKKQIQAYFILPVDYQKTFHARQVYFKQPNPLVNQQFSDLLALNILNGQPENVISLIMDGPRLDIHALAEKKTDQPESPASKTLRFFISIAASYMLFAAIMSTAGYLTQSVVEEKENRTMEILITSTSPSAIMTGKIIALAGVGLTQLLAWFGIPLLILMAIAPSIPVLQGTIRWDTLLLISLTALATFLLASTLLAMIGATLTNPSEGQQITSFIMLPLMIPYIFVNTIMAAPSGPIAIFLSFFPITASITLLFRLAFATVPAWQILVSTGVVLLSAAGAFWLAGRVFRLGMLRYGKRVTWKEILSAVIPHRSRKESA